MSTNPGVTTKLVASITWLALPEKFPIASIIPFLIKISMQYNNLLKLYVEKLKNLNYIYRIVRKI